MSDQVPTRVIYNWKGRIATRVFGSREMAEEFGKTVKDPEYQNAAEYFPPQHSLANSKKFHHRTYVQSKKEAVA